MKLTEKYRINGAALVMPDGDVQMQFENRESPDSGVDESGFYHRVTERAAVGSWYFRYSQLTQQEYAYLLSILPAEGSFTFTHPQPADGSQTQTCAAYLAGYSVRQHGSPGSSYCRMEFTVKQC